MSEEGLQCAFVAGLSEHAEQFIQVSSQMEDLDLPQVLAWAWAILKNFTDCVEQMAVPVARPGAMSAMDPIPGFVTVSSDVKLPEVRMPSSEEPSHAIDASGRDTLLGTVWEMGKGVRIQCQSPPQSTYKWHAACEACSNWWNTTNGSCGYWLHAVPSPHTMLSGMEAKRNMYAYGGSKHTLELWSGSCQA